MISNYYTLAAVARSLQSQFVHWKLGTPFTQRRNELTIPLGRVMGEPERSIVVSCDPSANFLILRRSVSRAARNSADIFPAVDGREVRTFRMHPSDRVLTIHLDDGSELRAQFFGSQANVFFREAPDSEPVPFLTSRRHAQPAGGSSADAVSTALEERILAAVAPQSQAPVAKTLRHAVPTLGPVLARETLFRASIDPQVPAASLNETIIRALVRAADNIIEELTKRPLPRILSVDGEPIHFSLIPLHHLESADEEVHEDISAGILRFLSFRKKRHSFLSRKQEIMSAMTAENTKIAASLEAATKAIPEPGEADLLERFGKILHLNLNSLRTGMTVFDTADPFEHTEVRRSIPLEPALTPARNAERYFDRARKARARAVDLAERVRELGRRSDRLREIVLELETISGTEELDEFIHRYRQDLSISVSSSGTSKRDDQPPFRTYTVHGGFAVWVGKSSANNDMLTTRYTAKNDLWFHARGVAGSHVVLKAGSGKGEISKRAILEAAAIAAYYSKMKNARHVAVSVCEGKFVRKPRKAPPGTVTIEREDVLFVDPGLPASRD